MKYILVAGKRDFNDYERFCREMDQIIKGIGDDVVIVEGSASGTDYMAGKYATEHKIPLKFFIADWNRFGRSAGPIRNEEMVSFLDGKDAMAVFFWDGKSRGTADCLRRAGKHNIPTVVIRIEGE